MKYAIYFTWNDGFEDSFNVSSASEKAITQTEREKRQPLQ